MYYQTNSKKINEILRFIFTELKSNIISPNLKEKVLFMLKKIGYDTREVKINSKKFNQLIKAYQRHYRQSVISGEVDCQTYQLIKRHYKDVLTL